jgi:hypothetical protein
MRRLLLSALCLLIPLGCATEEPPTPTTSTEDQTPEIPPKTKGRTKSPGTGDMPSMKPVP